MSCKMLTDRLREGIKPNVSPFGVEFLGMQSRDFPGHEDRILRLREVHLRVIHKARHKAVNGRYECEYTDPVGPGALKRCVRCGEESVEVGSELHRKYSWRQLPAVRDVITGKDKVALTGDGFHTAEAWTCGICLGLPTLLQQHIRGKGSNSNVGEHPKVRVHQGRGSDRDKKEAEGHSVWLQQGRSTDLHKAR